MIPLLLGAVGSLVGLATWWKSHRTGAYTLNGKLLWPTIPEKDFASALKHLGFTKKKAVARYQRADGEWRWAAEADYPSVPTELKLPLTARFAVDGDIREAFIIERIVPRGEAFQ